MGLKHFHLIFITASILLCILFGLWAVQMYAENSSANYLVTAIASFAIAIGLAMYELFFLRKIKA